MKKMLFSFIISFATLSFCIAQQIEMTKVFGGYKFSQNGKDLKMSNLIKTMESNQEAYELIKKAKSNNTIATIIGFAGGGLIGWQLGTAVSGGDANWTLGGIGAGLIAIGIPIASSANKKAKHAVEVYNSSLNSTSNYQSNSEYKLTINGNGMGISMTF